MPTLDRIIERGAYFRSAYTPAPVCVPARQCFLTGLYACHSGCTGFDTPLPSDVLTMPAHFANYGYNPVAAGKMHFLAYDQRCMAGASASGATSRSAGACRAPGRRT